MRKKVDYGSREFRSEYHSDEPLGALYTPERTVFRVWSPLAERVTLRLVPECRDIQLERRDRGVWETAVEGDLDGVLYEYTVTAEHFIRRTADPWARACGANGWQSMVIDLRRTDPEGWEDDRPPELPPENVIYEVHVKDFSWDAASGIPKAYRGKFKALTVTGTTLGRHGEVPTGLDYLKRLGVTHVQLMPVFDFGSLDEVNRPTRFNWGYDPLNYNIPEGSYSTDPFDGAVRIRELKEAIQALHRAGLRVIMDVVYNHTYLTDSWFDRMVPRYFYRRWPNGKFSNGSGCGNDVATERSMCSRYILESVLYWAEEYHFDGFRFDLMGLLDVPLMNEIRSALDRRWGRGEKLMLGEPWRAGDTAADPGTVLADKDNVGILDKHIAVFCDSTRDAVKGDLWTDTSRGFVNSGWIDSGKLLRCLRGWAGPGGWIGAASQCVNYISCHDDHTLWDKLALAWGVPFDCRSEDLIRQNKLAAAINFSCQGNLFLLSGEEFGRTKRGIKNSYRSPLSVNRLDWRRAWEYSELGDYYRGLIALRKLLPGLRDKSPTAFERIVPWAWGEQGGPTAAFLVDNSGPGTAWGQVMLIFNAGSDWGHVQLPEGSWEVLADAGSSFAFESPRSVCGEAAVEPVSALILGRRLEGQEI